MIYRYTHTYILIPESQDPGVVSRVTNKAALEECYVEYRGIEVYKLEDEHLEREVVVKLRLGPVHLWNTTQECCVE